MDLNELLVFVKVVQAGSFVGAARDLGMPTTTVSRKVSQLEERLDARLLQRTTRTLNLTDVGRAYFQHAQRVVAELEQADLAVSKMQDVPKGQLRVTTPLNFAVLGPIIASFLSRFPEVDLEMVCADRVIDLVQEGFDVAIRAGQLPDSALIARPLGALHGYVVASPAYLKRHGKPKEPRDLERMPCVAFGAGAERTTWRLHKDGKSQSVHVRARLVANDFDVLAQAARSGLGIAVLSAFRCEEDLRRKKLMRVLCDWCSPPVPLHAVYPSTRHLSPTVKAFLDHLSKELTLPPWDRTAGK